MEIRPQVVRVAMRPEELRTPGEPFEGIERIAVMRLDRFGDLVLTLPALAALRETYGRVRIELCVRPELAPLAQLFDGIDAVIPLGAGGWADTLRARDLDLGVCISRGPAAAWALRAAGVRHRVGTARRWYSSLFTRTVEESRRSAQRHEVEYALSFAHRAGAPPGPAHFLLRVRQPQREEAHAWLAERGIEGSYVVLHPGSGGSCPRWPLGHYEELTGRLLEQGRQVVWSIGPAERSWGSRQRVACFEGPVGRLAALLQGASLVISNSTGPLHLAAALGTPTVALHAPWPSCAPERWGPYAENGAAIVAKCSPAHRWTRQERRRRAVQLMAGIEPDFVCEALHRL